MSNWSIVACQSCNDFSVWVDTKLVSPRNSLISPLNDNLIDDIKSFYNKAALIFVNSPKGATVLLRLALQKLFVQVGKEGEDINNDVKELVAKGLSPNIQKSP